MKFIKPVALLSIAVASLMAVPAPSEYEMTHFQRAVRDADLIIEGTVMSVETTVEADIRTITKDITVDSIYKGYTGKQSLIVTEIEQIDLIGGYDHKFIEGMETIICLNDNEELLIGSNALDQFNIESDTIAAPHTGLGFADNMKMYKDPELFRELIAHTIENEELIELIPFQPSISDEMKIEMKVDLSGGTILDSIVAKQSSSNQITVRVYKTLCEDLCIDLYQILDTTIALPSIERAGGYKVIAKSINAGDGDIVINPMDTISFELYPSNEPTAIDNGKMAVGSKGAIRSFTSGSTVQFDLSGIENVGMTSMQLSVVDMKGRILWSGDDSQIVNSKLVWNGEAISKGVYLFQIKSGNSFHTERFLVQ